MTYRPSFSDTNSPERGGRRRALATTLGNADIALLVLLGVVWAVVTWRTSGRPVKVVLPLAFTAFCIAAPFVQRWW